MSARDDYPGNPIDNGLVVIQGDCLDRAYAEIDLLRGERDVLIARRDESMRKSAALKARVKARPIFAWYDLWVGVFIDRPKRRVYIFPLPCIGIVIGHFE